MLNFWQRVTKLSDTSLTNKALLENITLRTNWIITIEKFLGSLALTEHIDNTNKFKKKAREALQKQFNEYWRSNVASDIGRMLFYKSIKNQLEFESCLDIPSFEGRKAIAKVRCSHHSLQIEKGRHNRIPRENRICNFCPLKVVETEEHFLTVCSFYYIY